ALTGFLAVSQGGHHRLPRLDAPDLPTGGGCDRRRSPSEPAGRNTPANGEASAKFPRRRISFELKTSETAPYCHGFR
ncbi:MAG: hypothetical protein ACK53L_29165, partial [Pirellulaceae bacterium]